MSTRYEETGRARQKARTRAALVEAVRELLLEMQDPTVEQAADLAGVSRTTAYRYFPNQRALIVASYPELDVDSLLDDDAPADPLARFDIVSARYATQLLEHEHEQRAQLRLALQFPSSEGERLHLRQGRAIQWFKEALSPLKGRLSEKRLHRLALAIRATSGIEAFVWLTDIGGLSRPAAIELMRSSGRTLIEAAMNEATKH